IDVVCPDETAGEDPLKMVETVLECLPAHQAERKKGEEYQHIWIVFDKDNFEDYNFNNAINKATAHGIKVAWSNQAFEYWFILHFMDHQGGGMHRDGYYDLINQHIGKYGEKYDKDSKNVSRKMFDILAAINPEDNVKPKRTFRQLAWQRAKRIYEHHQQEGKTPAMSESCTTVFELVALLDPTIAKDNAGKCS
ncbi:MAG TPA: RloB family protein, partial [Chitinophagales bacterium]|nr:RloB family protein [Chitinophagales bacterium]